MKKPIGYIIESAVEGQLLEMGKQLASDGNHNQPILAIFDGLSILKKRRDDIIFSLNPTINQEGKPLMRPEAKG